MQSHAGSNNANSASDLTATSDSTPGNFLSDASFKCGGASLASPYSNTQSASRNETTESPSETTTQTRPSSSC
jgi:hypothetical protein